MIDQETAVVRQRLLMEPYLAVGIGVQQHEHAVGKLQRLLRQHAVPDRNIQQDPALRIAGDQLAHIVAPAFRLLLTLALHFQPFRRIQAAKGQKVEVFTVTQRPFLPAAAVPLRAAQPRASSNGVLKCRRSRLSGVKSIANTDSPSCCNAQASAAVTDVVPIPPRNPCSAITGIDQWLPVVCANSANSGQRVIICVNCSCREIST